MFPPLNSRPRHSSAPPRFIPHPSFTLTHVRYSPNSTPLLIFSTPRPTIYVAPDRFAHASPGNATGVRPPPTAPLPTVRCVVLRERSALAHALAPPPASAGCSKRTPRPRCPPHAKGAAAAGSAAANGGTPGYCCRCRGAPAGSAPMTSSARHCKTAGGCPLRQPSSFSKGCSCASGLSPPVSLPL